MEELVSSQLMPTGAISNTTIQKDKVATRRAHLRHSDDAITPQFAVNFKKCRLNRPTVVQIVYPKISCGGNVNRLGVNSKSRVHKRGHHGASRAFQNAIRLCRHFARSTRDRDLHKQCGRPGAAAQCRPGQDLSLGILPIGWALWFVNA